MDFNYPAETESFRQEIRDFLNEVVTPEYLEEQRTISVDRDGHGPATQTFVDKLRERGYLTLHWPKEYGGQGRPVFEQAVFAEEMARAGATNYIVGSVGLNMVAPALMHYGSEEQKRDILPKIASGEINFAQVFTEPEAGSDLAGLKTTAVRDGDEFVVNGTKVFITWAFHASHGYLLARTDQAAPKHRGLSLFMLDMKAPGVDIHPLHLIDGGRHGLIYLENVRIPRSMLIGEENRGWYHAAITLDFERAGMFGVTRNIEDIKRLLDFARKTERNGDRLSADPTIRKGLITAYRDARITRALAQRVLDIQGNGRVANSEASELSLHSRLATGRTAETKALVYGMYGQLYQDTPYSVEDGDGVTSWWRLAGRHAAGTIEIQKNIIAQRGLGMPR
ncbi:MAG: acyl-CoA dehydrogenase family protein [Dehalococcoidia bacterium]